MSASPDTAKPAEVTQAFRPAGVATAIGRYRWRICALLFFATTINYVDRQVLSILAKTLEDPKALAKPWTQHIFHKLRPDWDLREEVRCTENIKRGVYTGEYEGQ